MLSYRKSFEFSEGFVFNLGLGWQGKQTDKKTSLEKVDENCTVKCAVYEKQLKRYMMHVVKLR